MDPNVEVMFKLDHAVVGIVQADSTGRILYVNRQWCRMLGYAKDELLGRTLFDVTDPESLEATHAALQQVTRGREGVVLSKRYRRKDGSTLHAKSSVSPDYDDAGELTGVTAIVVDQTDQVLAAQSARAAEERLQEALAIGQMLAWEWNLRDGSSSFSSDPDVFWGGPVAGADGFVALVHPEDRDDVIEMLHSAYKGTLPYELQYRMLDREGRVRWMHTRRRIDYGSDGAPVCVRGITVDVTTSKRAELETQLLAEAGHTLGASLDYETTLANLAQVLVPRMADWYAVDLLEANGELERVSVYHPDPEKVALARQLHAKYPQRKDAPVGAWYAVRTGEPSLVAHIPDEMLERTAHSAEHLGIMRALGLSSFMSVPLRARGSVIGVITLVSAESGRRYDVADLDLARRIAERAAIAVDNARLFHALQAADRRKDEFLAMLAHELRNPLAPINMAAELLKMVAGENGQTHRAADIITRQVTHMTELVDDLLDVSRVTRGLVQLHKQPTDIKEVTAAALEQVQALIAARRHALRVVLGPEPLTVLGDRARLTQVIANLLNNAAKYTPPGGEIELRVEPDGDRVRIDVGDSGAGIDASLLPHVFELFTQGERTPDRTQGGLGIGLALVRSIVRLHDGDVQAHSAGLRRGSTFTVFLPRLMETAAAAELQEVGTGTRAGSSRVLVVDDNEDAATMVAEVLRLHGYSADVSNTAQDALDSASAGQDYDIYVLDIGLPDMTGYELARALRRAGRNTHAIFVALTGYGQENDRAASAAAGFDHHLVKPVDAGRLLRAIDATGPGAVS